MRAPMFLCLAVLLPVGCIQDLLDAGAALSPDTDASSSGTSTGEPPTPLPTTTAGSGVQTVTGLPGETSETGGTTTGGTTETPEHNEPPTVKLTVNKGHLSEAGTADLLLDVSMDVVKVRLSMNGDLLAELTPADFPYTYEALSAKDNGSPHVFVAEVEDAEGLTATDDAELTVQLPASGAERCLFEDKAAKESVILALAYTDEAIVAVGARDTGAGHKATIWKLDPDHCEVVLPGWPKSIGNWTGEMNLAALTSRATSIAVDEVGDMAVGITLIENSKPRRYVAFLTPGGSLLWEKLGKIGEEVAGIAVVPHGVMAVGWVRTSENPLRTDAMVWRHLEGGVVWPETLRAPLTPDEFFQDDDNQLSEWARAVLYDPVADLVLVVGDREFRPNNIQLYRRTFVTRFVPNGGKFGVPWTSPGDPMLNDGANSVALCGEDVLLGGWTRDWPPGSLPTPLTRWIDHDGAGDTRVAEQLAGAQTFGIACDRESKVVHAALRSSGELDAQVFAFADAKKPRIWYDNGSPDNDGAGTVGCDARGFCAWGGFRSFAGKAVAVVRGHHP